MICKIESNQSSDVKPIGRLGWERLYLWLILEDLFVNRQLLARLLLFLALVFDLILGLRRRPLYIGLKGPFGIQIT